MAKHNAFLHIGRGIVGVDNTHTALLGNHTLAECGLIVPNVSAEHMERADLEMRRAWKAVGLKRKHVEGAWAEVCRRAYKTKSDVVLSQPGLLDAPADLAALALDGLFGFRVHLVLTAQDVPDDLEPALGPWTDLVTKPGRRHVVPVGLGLAPTTFAAELAAIAQRVQRERAERRLFKRSRTSEHVA